MAVDRLEYAIKTATRVQHDTTRPLMLLMFALLQMSEMSMVMLSVDDSEKFDIVLGVFSPLPLSVVLLLAPPVW